MPGVSLAAEHVPYSATAHNVVYRLRLSARVDGQDLSIGGQTFKLQYATSTGGPWADVGPATSTDTWRGYDNPSVADGATLSVVILSTSAVVQSYEEENPSAAIPNAMAIGVTTEWDWVVHDYAGANNTTYYFRMVQGNGTAFDSYLFYPEMAIPGGTTLTQQDYRWYANTGAITVTSTLAAQNVTTTGVVQSTVLRLRMNAEVAGADLAAGTRAFKLQYTTNTSTGPWTDVGLVTSTNIWRGYDNPALADGATLPSTVLTGSNVAESYEEQNPSALNPATVSIGQRGEWDWVVQHNGAVTDTVYFFRMVKADGSVLDSYTNYPTARTAPQTFTQQDYRWYANTGAITVTSTLAAENSAASGIVQQQVIRLRMNVRADGLDMNTTTRAFRLQYATMTTGPWTDVGSIGSTTTTWRGFDNGAIADGATLPSVVLVSSDVAESYEEESPSALNPTRVPAGQEGEWDWAVQNRSRTTSTYYFRMVASGGTVLSSYANYPQVSTVVPGLYQRDYRWFTNADSGTPGAALAAQNATTTGITAFQVVRLRMNVEVATTTLETLVQSFILQFSTSSGAWTDVGGIGSSAIWRGFNNASVSDGTSLPSLLLTGSNVAQTYEEANPSADNPSATGVGLRAEWDWVLQNNSAPADTYYFRMVGSDSTPLTAYTNTPQLTAIDSTQTQDGYRWYQNTNAITPLVSYSPQNTPATSTATALVYRLRVNVQSLGITLVTSTEAYKLQFSTNTGGPWTDVGGLASGTIWRGFDNTAVVDGTALPSLLLTGSTVLESYEEGNPSITNPGALFNGNVGEWDWVVQDNGAAASTTYYFRMVKSDSTALNAYNCYPTLTMPAARTFTQRDYRWFTNANSATPGAALAAQNVTTTSVAPATVLRLRMNVEVGNADLSTTTQAFKLQFATSAAGPWTDVGLITSTNPWRGLDNGTPADGATVASLLLTGSNALESYEEQNPSANNPNAVFVGQRGEWDWVVQNNSAPAGTYFFRMVKPDGTALDSYTNYPQATAVVTTFTQRDYGWFTNANSVTPGAALAAQNVTTTSVAPTTVLRLRMNVEVGGLLLSTTTQAFKLQYATTSAGPWTDVGLITSTDPWRGFNNTTPTDGATIPSLLLTGSTKLESYEEQNPSANNPNAIFVGQRGEWDWVVQNNTAPAGTYFFRMVKPDGTALDGYVNYPQATAVVSTFTQRDYRWYRNANAVNPATNDGLAAQSTAMTAIHNKNVAYRLRMNVEIGGVALGAATQAFKLQYSTNTSTGPWTDVGFIGSITSTWRGVDNGTPVDGATVAAGLLLATSNVRGTYEENNPSATNPFPANIGQRIEYDWVVSSYSVTHDTIYFFRVVQADGTALDTYTLYPTVRIHSLSQEIYRWYDNINALSPTVPLAAENAIFTVGSVTSSVYRLRMNVQSSYMATTSHSFVLQYATTTTGPWTDVGSLTATSSLAVWRGFNNATPIDGNPVAALLLLSTSIKPETYEEVNPSANNPNFLSPGQRGEWDWVIKANGATANTTYYFRMAESDGTALTTYTRYPSVITIPPVIAADDFESGGTSGGTGWLAAWTLSGEASMVTTVTPHTGTYHLRLRGSGAIDRAERTVNLSGKTSVRLQFWAKGVSFDPLENVVAQVSTNGSAFTTLKTWVVADADGFYRFWDFDVSSFISSTFYVRFESNLGDTSDEFYVDDLQVVGQ